MRQEMGLGGQPRSGGSSSGGSGRLSGLQHVAAAGGLGALSAALRLGEGVQGVGDAALCRLGFGAPRTDRFGKKRS